MAADENFKFGMQVEHQPRGTNEKNAKLGLYSFQRTHKACVSVNSKAGFSPTVYVFFAFILMKK